MKAILGLMFLIVFLAATVWGANTPPEDVRPAILIILCVLGAAVCCAPSKPNPLP